MKKLVKFLKIVAIAAVVIYIAGFMVVNSLTILKPGYRGVEVVLGEITPESFKNGPVWHWPFVAEVLDVYTREQVYKYEIDSKSKDMQYVGVSGAVNYTLNGDLVHVLYDKVGTDYEPVLLHPLLEGALNQIVGQNSVEYIINTQDKIREAIVYIMNDQLRQTNLVKIEDLRLFSPKFDPAFQKAIEDKVVAEQIAEKAKIDTRRVEEEAKQMLKKLEAEAEGLKLRSEVLRNPLIVQYEYAKAMGNWKGNLPSTLMVGEKGVLPIMPINVKK